MGKSDSREPLVWRIVFGMNWTTPVSSVAVTTSKALEFSLNGFSIVPVSLTRSAAAEAMMV